MQFLAPACPWESSAVVTPAQSHKSPTMKNNGYGGDFTSDDLAAEGVAADKEAHVVATYCQRAWLHRQQLDFNLNACENFLDDCSSGILIFCNVRSAYLAKFL